MTPHQNIITAIAQKMTKHISWSSFWGEDDAKELVRFAIDEYERMKEIENA